MNYAFSPDEESFQAQVKAFVGGTSSGGGHSLSERDYYSQARQIRQSLGQKGWLTIGWPPPHGLGSLTKEMILREEMAYFCVPRANDYGTALAGPLIIGHGTDAQKDRHLGPLARGEEWWCVGFTEPLAGSDLANIRTRAVQDGERFVVNGQKDYGEWAQASGWCHLLVRSEEGSSGSLGLTWFLMALDSPGIFRNPVEYTTGRVFAEIFLDDVKVSKHDVLGLQGQGWEIATEFLTWAQTGVEFVGWARRLRDLVIESKRGQGKSYPIHKTRLAEASVDIEVSRLISYRSVWLRSQGKLSRREASMAKLFCSEVYQKVAGAAMEMVGLPSQLTWGGGPGSPGPEVQTLFLEAAASTIYLGTSELHRSVIAG